MEERSFIRIHRWTDWVGCAVAFRIMVDGVEADRIFEGTDRVLAVAPGRHTVQARMHWFRSSVHAVALAPGESACFRTGATRSGCNRFLMIFAQFAEDGVVVMERVGETAQPGWSEIPGSPTG